MLHPKSRPTPRLHHARRSRQSRRASVLSRRGADVELRDVAIGWHACSKERSATHELVPSLRREDPDCEVDDFEGVFRFTLDGRPWVAWRVAAEGRLKPSMRTKHGCVTMTPERLHRPLSKLTLCYHSSEDAMSNFLSVKAYLDRPTDRGRRPMACRQTRRC